MAALGGKRQYFFPMIFCMLEDQLLLQFVDKYRAVVYCDGGILFCVVYKQNSILSR
jgi:hypothetical protein